MNRIIRALVDAPPRPKTSAELLSVVGTPLQPCPVCQSAIFGVLHAGGLACLGCQPDTVADTRQTAFRVIAVVGPDGIPRAADERTELAARAAAHAASPAPLADAPPWPDGRRPSAADAGRRRLFGWDDIPFDDSPTFAETEPCERCIAEGHAGGGYLLWWGWDGRRHCQVHEPLSKAARRFMGRRGGVLPV